MTEDTNYLKIPALSAHRLLVLAEDVKWGVLTEMDQSEAFLPMKQSASAMYQRILLAVVIIVLIGLTMGYFLTRPIGKISNDLSRLAEEVREGKLDRRSDPKKTSIDFRPIANGLNQLIEAFIVPIHEVMGVMSKWRIKI